MAIFRGFSFPMRFENGSLRFSELSNRSTELVDESIEHVAIVSKRQRPRRRKFGIGLIQETFKNLSKTNPGVVGQLTREAIATWEPRAKVEAVQIRRDDEEGVTEVTVFRSVPPSDETDSVTFELA